MGIKLATLYVLPYVVSIASSLLAANEVAPVVMNVVVSGTSATISQQVVNRSPKTDQLPTRQMRPENDVKEYFKVPAQVPIHRKTDSDCSPPIDVRGRCFA
jgi:hypothetical protein